MGGPCNRAPATAHRKGWALFEIYTINGGALVVWHERKLVKDTRIRPVHIGEYDFLTGLIPANSQGVYALFTVRNPHRGMTIWGN